MAQVLDSKDSSWWVFTLPAFLGTQPFINMADAWLMFSLLFAFLSLGLLSYLFSSGGIAWKNGRKKRGSVSIPGPRGLPFFGSLLTLSRGLPHRTLSAMAASRAAKPLMALSLGSTPLVITSDPKIAKEILNSPSFADRPPMQSAKQLLFERSLGFAPNGAHWRLLRRIASSHLFSPKMIAAHEPGRRLDCDTLLAAVADEQSAYGYVGMRKHLQGAALNNIMGSVFGKRFDLVNPNIEAQELKEMVEEGFELLGAFNWSDFLPWLRFLYDPLRINQRCSALVPRVRALVKGIIEEHKLGSSGKASGNSDFVDVLLSFQGEEKLEEEDMIAILWEMIFRGTDTTALLTEWILAELVLNPKVQAKLRNELDTVVGTHRTVTDADMASLPYLQAVVNETLRVHPPGPLLSWARLSSSDVQLSNGMLVPANTTAMVNMWSITHDPSVWVDPFDFKPERFLENEGGHNVDVRGNDLRLAPFGAGRRVCPGRNLGLVTVSLWVARLVHHFKWVPATEKPVDLREYLKLSCGMANPLFAVVIPRAVPF